MRMRSDRWAAGPVMLTSCTLKLLFFAYNMDMHYLIMFDCYYILYVSLRVCSVAGVVRFDGGLFTTLSLWFGSPKPLSVLLLRLSKRFCSINILLNIWLYLNVYLNSSFRLYYRKKRFK